MLGEAAEGLTDGSENRIWRLSFEFQSPHVIERRSKPPDSFQPSVSVLTFQPTVHIYSLHQEM